MNDSNVKSIMGDAGDALFLFCFLFLLVLFLFAL